MLFARVRPLGRAAAALAVVALAAGCSATTRQSADRPAPTAVPSAGATSALSVSPPAVSATPRSTTVRPRPPVPPTRRPAPAPAGATLPLRYSTGAAAQVITVTAAAATSTTATLQAWQRSTTGWVRVGGSVGVHLGSAGMTTHPREDLPATPMGSFGLTSAFGREPNPGTSLPYYQVGANDWWVSDVRSPLYNTHQRCTSCPFDTGASENLYAAGSVYDYAVVFDYNHPPAVSGAGSAFFLHVTDGGPTAGCVSMPQTTLLSLLGWLKPAAHPRVLIGVG